MKDRMELTWFEDDREILRMAVDATFLKNVFRGVNAESITKIAEMAERLKEESGRPPEDIGEYLKSAKKVKKK